jgi:hypothetical protein
VAALRELAGDEARRRQMGINGKHVVDDVFRLERFTEAQGEHLARHLGFSRAKVAA